MRYIIHKALLYGLAVFCLIVVGFGLFANKANAQYYYPPITSPVNNTADYAYYRQICPADFTLTVYNTNQYMCFKLLGTGVSGTYYNNTTYTNVPSYPYYPAPVPPSTIPGCLPGYTYSQLTGQRCDGNYYYDNNNDLNGGDGTIRNFEVRDGDDDSPQEGDNNAEIAEVRFDTDNGDIELDRAEFDFEFTGSGSGEDLPWNTFDEVRLLSDGREIGRMSTDNRNDWEEEDDDTYRLVFSSLDETIRENDTADLTLEVDLNSDIEGSDNNDVSWDISVPDRGLRARDNSGDYIYAGNDSDNASIDIEEN